MSNLTLVEKPPMNWVHYSQHPDQIVMQTKYQQECRDDSSGMYEKPKGLWITPEHVEDNWFNWCKENEFEIARLNFIHDVKIKSDARILRLESAADLDAFTTEYGYSAMLRILGNVVDLNSRQQAFRESRRDGIEWTRVAENYQGILIPTYIHERRLFTGCDWYYPWDCASGCIWDAEAVESITVRPMESAGYVSKDWKASFEKLIESLR